MLNPSPQSDLTLSAAPATDQPDEGSAAPVDPSAPVYVLSPLDPDGRTPHELTVREYAELAHIPEAELRALWGDR